ncbi:MAG: hypothetical protein K2Q12_08095 [Rickettsiales bacterium]|nr:hypothetical protein [Rickettsiales bacterium]
MGYDIAGDEPTLEEIQQDPIFRHLRLYDGLPTTDWPELMEDICEPLRHAA